MITISNVVFLHWRNQLADHPVAVVSVDLGAARGWNVGLLGAGAHAALTEWLAAFQVQPTDRSATGVLAAICLVLQKQKFDLPGVADGSDTALWFATLDPHFANVAARGAVAMLNHLIAHPGLSGQAIATILGQLEEQCGPAALDQSVRALAAEATARSIPWFRMAPDNRDIQLGQGRKQARLRETLNSNESALALRYSSDKADTCRLLSAVGLPVGRFGLAATPDQAVATSDGIGYPVVIKPLHGRKGQGVMVGLGSAAAVRAAARTILSAAPRILVQSLIPGDDHRVLVVAGRLVAAARREPAAVAGDGRRTIEELIRAANTDPRRGRGFSKLMNLIEIDAELERVIAGQKLTLSSVPPAGKIVRLRATANISTGGTAVDVTDIIHPDNARLAERAALTIGLTVAGVDFLTPDIARSWHEVGGGICEVNAVVGLRPHWLADPGRNVVGPLLDTIFPSGNDGRIPTALITGSKGKTTTTRMLDRILHAAGHIVGRADTDGVTIDCELVSPGDKAGTTGAAIVLRDPTVTAAVLETARGGILKRGIYVDRCDVAVLLNVFDEQVGIDGIDTVDDMARLKRKVLDTARGAVVLNAEDPRCLALSREYPVERTILFGLEAGNEGLAAHGARGGTVVTLAPIEGRETIVVRSRGKAIAVAAVNELPATFEGLLRKNVANALAATALAHGLSVEPASISAGLRSYGRAPGDTQGRFTLIRDLPALVVFDRAANGPAMVASLPAIDSLTVKGSRVCLLTVPGDRGDRNYAAAAAVLADRFDRFVCFDRLDWRRGRSPGEIARILRDKLAEAGVAAEQIQSFDTQAEAIRAAAELGAAGGLLVLFGTSFDKTLPELRAAFAAIAEAQSPAA